jgi:hypothetical protein
MEGQRGKTKRVRGVVTEATITATKTRGRGSGVQFVCSRQKGGGKRTYWPIKPNSASFYIEGVFLVISPIQVGRGENLAVLRAVLSGFSAQGNWRRAADGNQGREGGGVTYQLVHRCVVTVGAETSTPPSMGPTQGGRVGDLSI